MHIYTTYYDKGDNRRHLIICGMYGKALETAILIIKGYAYFAWQGDKVYEMYNAFDPTLYTQAILEQQ